MPPNGRKNSAVIDRAMQLGAQQAASAEPDAAIRIRLTPTHLEMVKTLCGILGLSVRSVLNVAARYAVYAAQSRGVAPTSLREFPRRLEGTEIEFAPTGETLAKLREVEMLDNLNQCAVAGLKLLHRKIVLQK
jgi:hypothetical protein